MPSGRTSRPALQAPDLLATLPACSGKRQNHPCRLHHECKLGDQTKDDADKEPREERSCGRSQTSLYNTNRPHTSLNGLTPTEFATRPNRGQIQNRLLGTRSDRCVVLGPAFGCATQEKCQRYRPPRA